MKMLITCGLPGSGKTSYALDYVRNNPGTVNVNRDDIRFSQYGVYYGPPIDESFVTTVHHGMINAAFKRRHDVVVSDTNLNRKSVKSLVALANRWGAAVEFVYFDVPMDELIKRDEQRSEKPVGIKVLRDFAKRFNIPADGTLPRFDDLASMGIPDMQPLEYIDGLPMAVICDIDSTVAVKGDRSPYDYTCVFEDTPMKTVLESLQIDRDYGFEIIFMSGREDSCYDDTLKWLNLHFGGKFQLFMRKAGDKRQDSIIKNELVDEHIRNKYNVHHAWDDRRNVIDAYRKKGIVVYDVAGNEF